MKLNRHSGLALVLIFFGALILLHKIGMHSGHFLSFLFPVAMIFLGWLGVKNGRSFIGLILMGIGALALLVKLSGFIAIVVAIALIVCGIGSMKRKSSYL